MYGVILAAVQIIADSLPLSVGVTPVAPCDRCDSATLSASRIYLILLSFYHTVLSHLSQLSRDTVCDRERSISDSGRSRPAPAL
jgi:hypothetical protein